ncbi:MAG: SH3 domain-containing protein [Actinobacteria bacterium]|nr:SH3 domain-containing protein [Actinomycetota bacterium]
MSVNEVIKNSKKWKTLFGVGVLLVLLLVVMGWWADFRGSPTRPDDTRAGSPTSEITTPAGEASSGDQAEGRPQLVTVIIEGLNFRTAPSSASQRIGRLSAGTELTYLGTENGWYRVRDSEGREGYVSANEEYTKIQ